jgi:hypothetical protein
MANLNKVRRVALVSAAFLGIPAVGWAVELDRSAVIVKTPDQFMWRDPTNSAASNQTILLGNPNQQVSISTKIPSSPSGSETRTFIRMTASSP